MNLKYYYWYFQSAIPERICDDIVRYGQEQEKETAITGTASKDNLTKLELKNIQKKRKSDVVWMSDRWIYKEIQPYIYQANYNAGGILNGILARLVNLPNTRKVSFTIGIATLTKNPIIILKTKTYMANIENLA